MVDHPSDEFPFPLETAVVGVECDDPFPDSTDQFLITVHRRCRCTPRAFELALPQLVARVGFECINRIPDRNVGDTVTD
ncbi:hypothetical protein JCM18750_02610 [Halostagnicola bangensis]